MPLEHYRRALTTYAYKNEGIEAEIEKHCGIELEHTESFRLIGQFTPDTVEIKVYSNWVQPTRT